MIMGQDLKVGLEMTIEIHHRYSCQCVKGHTTQYMNGWKKTQVYSYIVVDICYDDFSYHKRYCTM